MTSRCAVALVVFGVAARAAGEAPSALWDDVAHPNRPRCAALLDEARRFEAFDRASAPARAAEAARRCPERFDAQALLGHLLFESRQTLGAREPLERARRLLPADDHDARLAFELGYVRAVAGDVEGSLAEYRRSLELGGLTAGDRWLLQYDLGDDLMALGRLGEAIDAYRRAVRLKPDESMPRLALAVALDRDQEAELSQAELGQALRIDPFLRKLYSGDFSFVPAADAHYYVALAHALRGRTGPARAELRAFVSALPDGPYAARARDHLERLATVDARELMVSPGVDARAVAAALAPLAVELEHCLPPPPPVSESSLAIRPAPSVKIRIVRSDAGVVRVDAAGLANDCMQGLVARAHLPSQPAALSVELALAPPSP